jgi:GT2 family glycosyltransferase
MRKTAYIVILNYNGWQDTIECLESVFKSDYSDYRVIVCDNGSTNDSVEQIKSWAQGRTEACGENAKVLPTAIMEAILPLIEKPIGFDLRDAENLLEEKVSIVPGEKLTLIYSKTNRGFSGGMNMGLCYAMAQEDFAYAWFLNNDIVVDKKALSAMVEASAADTKSCGIYGSVLCDYKEPERIQCIGGTLNAFSFKTKPVCRNWKYSELKEGIPLGFYQGASFMVTRNIVEAMGLFDEAYFLYFEEINFTLAAREKGFDAAYVKDSIVYHKGAQSTTRLASVVQDYHFARSRTIFAKRYYPQRMVFLAYKIFEQVLKYSFKGHFANAKAVMQGAKEGFFYQKNL